MVPCAAGCRWLGDLLCYPNRMAFDIMPGGGKPPEPKGLLVVKVKAVTNIKGGGDLFSKVRTPPAGPAWAPLAHPSAFSRYQQQQAQSMITGGHGLSGQVPYRHLRQCKTRQQSAWALRYPLCAWCARTAAL